MAQEQNFEQLKQVHGILMTIAWFLLENLGIWSLYFKYTPYGLYMHAFFMAMVGFINAVAPILMIARNGPKIILEYYFHHTWGFVLYIIFPFLLISGSICLISKLRPSILPEVVRQRTIGHSVFGWVFILLVKVPLLIAWRTSDHSSGNILFGVILACEILSYSLYFYLKFKREKMEESPQQKTIPSMGLRSIKSLKDLKIYSSNFFIFSNRVFNISEILATHPGGWEIIQAIKGREVDRFIYGVDPIQFYDVPKVSHSVNSIDLAGPPIAILQIPRIFSIRQFNQAQVSLVTCHEKELKIHTIYLELNHQKCNYSGYSDKLQLGQYYSLTMDKKKTRLYTIVNFLQPENIKLIMNISKGQIQFKTKTMFSVNSSNNSIEENDKQFRDVQLIKNQKDLNNTTVITLLIKKYNDGQFTSQFLNYNNLNQEVIISQPRGLGLSLDCITSNNIVIFAGGTGLYPFSDFIDLLFKAMLIENGHPMTNIIENSDPVLKKKPFENLIISLYIAVNQLDQLHPIILYECNQLSKSKNFKCYAKVKGANLNKLKQKYGNISLQGSRFEAIVDKHCNEDRETMFYMCGPVRFTKSIVNQLKKNNMPESYYLIV